MLITIIPAGHLYSSNSKMLNYNRNKKRVKSLDQKEFREYRIGVIANSLCLIEDLEFIKRLSKKSPEPTSVIEALKNNELTVIELINIFRKNAKKGNFIYFCNDLKKHKISLKDSGITYRILSEDKFLPLREKILLENKHKSSGSILEPYELANFRDNVIKRSYQNTSPYIEKVLQLKKQTEIPQVAIFVSFIKGRIGDLVATLRFMKSSIFKSKGRINFFLVIKKDIMGHSFDINKYFNCISDNIIGIKIINSSQYKNYQYNKKTNSWNIDKVESKGKQLKKVDKNWGLFADDDQDLGWSEMRELIRVGGSEANIFLEMLSSVSSFLFICNLHRMVTADKKILGNFGKPCIAISKYDFEGHDLYVLPKTERKSKSISFQQYYSTGFNELGVYIDSDLRSFLNPNAICTTDRYLLNILKNENYNYNANNHNENNNTALHIGYFYETPSEITYADCYSSFGFEGFITICIKLALSMHKKKVIIIIPSILNDFFKRNKKLIQKLSNKTKKQIKRYKVISTRLISDENKEGLIKGTYDSTKANHLTYRSFAKVKITGELTKSKLIELMESNFTQEREGFQILIKLLKNPNIDIETLKNMLTYNRINPFHIVANKKYSSYIPNISEAKKLAIFKKLKNLMTSVSENSNPTLDVCVVNTKVLNQQTFQCILNVSNILSGATGDQTFLEQLLGEKLVCYQIMKWKTNIIPSLCGFIKSLIEENYDNKNKEKLIALADIHDFYYYQKTNKHYIGDDGEEFLTNDQRYDRMVKIYTNKNKSLRTGAHILSESIERYKNLENTMVPLILKGIERAHKLGL